MIKIDNIVSGTVNDDFVHDWFTIRVKETDGQESYYKVDRDGNIFNFFTCPESSETTLTPLDDDTLSAIKKHISEKGIITWN